MADDDGLRDALAVGLCSRRGGTMKRPCKSCVTATDALLAAFRAHVADPEVRARLVAAAFEAFIVAFKKDKFDSLNQVTAALDAVLAELFAAPETEA